MGDFGGEEFYVDAYILDPSTHVNVSNPNAPVKFPGFGFWPLWYWEMFRNLTITRNITETAVDSNDRDMGMCDVVKDLFGQGLTPIDDHLIDTPLGDPKPTDCSPFWDGVSCFPATAPGQTRFIPCMAEFGGVQYDTSGRVFDILFGTLSVGLSYRDPNKLVRRSLN